MGRWSVPGAADGCAQFRGGLIGSRGGLIGSRGGTIGRTGGCLGPFMRRLTPQVVAQAGRPHCHLSGPAAQERVKATSKRAHAHTSLPPLRGQRAGTTGNASPHQKAKKSPFQQHDLSILIVGPGGVWVFRTVCFERVVLSSPGCLWPGRMDDHEEVLEAHA